MNIYIQPTLFSLQIHITDLLEYEAAVCANKPKWAFYFDGI